MSGEVGSPPGPARRVVVIGAGAAGTMAAIFAAAAGVETLLVERTADGGRKILISGGGRCNILPAQLDESRFVSEAPAHLVRRVVRSWPLREQVAFFERELGLPLVEEVESAKLFPASQRARDVRDRLLDLARRHGARLVMNTTVIGFAPDDGGWRIDIHGAAPLHADAVVVATGGLSVPSTGSDGAGLRIVERLGHAVRPTYPALTPLVAQPAPFAILSGISLPVTITARADGLSSTATGGFLFTHHGYSGPAVLDVSHVAVRSRAEAMAQAVITVRWTARGEEDWTALLRPQGSRTVLTAVSGELPARLAEALIETAGVDPRLVLAHLGRTDRLRLVETLMRGVLPWTGDEGYKKAEVTGGGVNLTEINPRTMESRKHKGLFLCGELLDAFGPIGGYNFLWAWATGRAAGLGASATIKGLACANRQFRSDSVREGIFGMISVSGVSMRFGSKILFEEVTTTFSAGRRYGLTGPNGAGKSTFMKLLTGEAQPQRGTVNRPRKLGVLRQDQYAFDEYRVIDTVIMGNDRLWTALKERDALYEKADMTHDDGMRLGELEGIVGEEDGYSAESDAAVLLQGLDIPDELHERKMAELQGGQKVRVLVAQALYGSPEALLLDEPTNHLDLDSIHWLQTFLERYQGTLIVISHDRHFLNKVCTHIADIDYQTIITYTGGYDDMVLAKTQIRSTIEADNAQREKKIAQLNDFIQRFGAGTRASQVTSRRKEVERLQTTELARSNIQRPYIKFTTKRPSGKVPFECKSLNKAHGALKVIKNFSAIVNRGEKIVLVGRNGVGKTTMLKALLADAPDRPASPADLDSGTIRWGHEVSIGYFPQDHTGAIEKGMTAVEWLHQFDPDASRQEIHGLLGQMLFSGEEGLKPTEALSGGETARLLFCRIMLLKPNVLILDEPTNHLDLESINALNVALQKFEGTVLLVTHDQDLLEEVGTRVWHFEHGKIVDFKGTYEELTGTAAS